MPPLAAPNRSWRIPFALFASGPLQSTIPIRWEVRVAKCDTDDDFDQLGVTRVIGLSRDEVQAEIARRMDALDEAQEEAEHLGPYADLMRMMALTAFQRAADLVILNNERIEAQLRAAGIDLTAT